MKIPSATRTAHAIRSPARPPAHDPVLTRRQARWHRWLMVGAGLLALNTLHLIASNDAPMLYALIVGFHVLLGGAIGAALVAFGWTHFARARALPNPARRRTGLLCLLSITACLLSGAAASMLGASPLRGAFLAVHAVTGVAGLIGLPLHGATRLRRESGSRRVLLARGVLGAGFVVLLAVLGTDTLRSGPGEGTGVAIEARASIGPLGKEAILSPQPGGERALSFEDVTQRSGIGFVQSFGDDQLSNLVEAVGGGAVFLDFDQDGWLDLYVVNAAYRQGVSQGQKPGTPPGNVLYHNRGDGTFEDVSEHAGAGDRGFGMGVAVADYDNDGYPDIYVTNYGPNVLYHNRGDGTFEDVTARAGVGDDRCGVGAVWLDYDKDGFPDLYAGNYIEFDPDYSFYYSPDGFPGPLAYAGQPDVLYHNLGNGRFEDVTESMGVLNPAGRAMGVSAADYDDDGYVDIYVANDAMENYLYRNEGGKAFRERGMVAGVSYNEMGNATSSMAVDFADYDGDGLLDIFVSDLSYCALYRNEGEGSFRDMTAMAGIAEASGQFVGWASAFIDFDNDGDVDLFKVNGDLEHLYGQEDQLFENTGRGTFEDVSGEAGGYFRRERVGRGACFGDYDNDGRVDAFIVNLGERGVLLRNTGTNRNSWLMVRLVGRRSNRDGLGARVTLRAGGRTQMAQKGSSSGYLSQNDPRLHFGLGEHEKAERIEITWPTGRVQVLEDVEAETILSLVEP